MTDDEVRLRAALNRYRAARAKLGRRPARTDREAIREADREYLAAAREARESLRAWGTHYDLDGQRWRLDVDGVPFSFPISITVPIRARRGGFVSTTHLVRLIDAYQAAEHDYLFGPGPSLDRLRARDGTRQELTAAVREAGRCEHDGKVYEWSPSRGLLIYGAGLPDMPRGVVIMPGVHLSGTGTINGRVCKHRARFGA